MTASESDTGEKRGVWNHRVIRHRHVSGWDEPYFYVVHEVHYEIDGDSEEIVAWSVEGRAPHGDTLAELREDAGTVPGGVWPSRCWRRCRAPAGIMCRRSGKWTQPSQDPT